MILRFYHVTHLEWIYILYVCRQHAVDAHIKNQLTMTQNNFQIKHSKSLVNSVFITFASFISKPSSKILREDPRRNMFVYDVTELEVKSADEAYNVFWKGTVTPYSFVSLLVFFFFFL